MSHKEEWGPWIEHDGRGCPVPKGTLGEAELRDRRVVFFMAQCGTTNGGPGTKSQIAGSAWSWGSSGPDYEECEVVRYRIRKPRGLTILENAMREIERVDA